MTKERYSVLIALFALLVLYPAKSTAQNIPPIADAGSSRYAAIDIVQLDGTGSYDLDNSGPLSYAWRQIAGPSVVIADANTATPTISGFVQTNDIQECEFELVVNDGESTSLPDTVKVIIVPAMIDYPDPDNKASSMEIATGVFDPQKPTLVLFGGGSCSYGGFAYKYLREWHYNANFINFAWYEPDRPAAIYTYDGCANMLITYLSSVAPNYKQPIQTWGFSTGAMPAIGVANYLNTTYGDARYAVNRVSLFDAGWGSGCHDVRPEVAAFCANPVDGEQCWVDYYYSKSIYSPVKGALNVYFPQEEHRAPVAWNYWSLDEATWLTDIYDGGVTAGRYLSVIGPGKNLQLSSDPESINYYFKWEGDYYPETQPLPTFSPGYMDFYDESTYPGRLPEPVTLVGPADGSFVDANGALLSCEVSENAVGYQLVFGRDPYHMVYLFSDTPSAPGESVTAFPFEQCWWTVRAYDEYGSTIHADPVHIKAESVIAQTIENATTGQTYASIQQAINDALAGDVIVVSPGVHQYLEHINLKGKSFTVRSTNPDDPATVAATVIDGGNQGTVVTVPGTQETDCVLAGLTILGGTVGVSCRAGSLTIRNCTIRSNGPIAIEFWEGYEPRIIDSTVLGYVHDRRLLAHWALDETEGSIAHDSVGNNDGTVNGGPLWQPTGGQIDGALVFDGTDDYVSTDFVLDPADGAFSVFAWVKGRGPGQVVISQIDGANWLLTDPQAGALMTELKSSGRSGSPLCSQTVVTDGNWHRVGLTWDGSNRILYADDLEVAKDTQPGLGSSAGGLYIGAGTNLDAASFFSGLIDDVRIYDRAITP